MEDFGDRLIKARERKGLSAPDAAKALHMPYTTYKAHENGSRGGRKNAEKYAKFYGVSLDWLLTGRGRPQGHPIVEIVEGLPPGRPELRPVVFNASGGHCEKDH